MHALSAVRGARAVRMASTHKQRAKLNLALVPFPSTLNSLPLSLVYALLSVQDLSVGVKYEFM